MFDESFLITAGLAEMPQTLQLAFLDHLNSELELRVGMVLSEGLSDDQLQEFDGLANGDFTFVITWLKRHAPEYEQATLFLQDWLNEADVGAAESIRDYAKIRWLHLNRPDSDEVIRPVREALSEEVIANRDAVLGSETNSQPFNSARAVSGIPTRLLLVRD